mgnify:CR=1 FL=1
MTRVCVMSANETIQWIIEYHEMSHDGSRDCVIAATNLPNQMID